MPNTRVIALSGFKPLLLLWLLLLPNSSPMSGAVGGLPGITKNVGTDHFALHI